MRILPIVAAALTLSAAKPTADVTLSFIEYRALGQVGQVRITTGFVHDPDVQKRMLANLASMDREGIILIAGDSVRRFSRRETIGGHSLETTITIYPAVGHGYRGGLATADITVKIDGKKKMDCAYDAGHVQLDDVDIQPLDNVLYVVGTYNDRPVEGYAALNASTIVDQEWLAKKVKSGR